MYMYIMHVEGVTVHVFLQNIFGRGFSVWFTCVPNKSLFVSGHLDNKCSLMWRDISSYTNAMATWSVSEHDPLYYSFSVRYT